MLSLMLFYHSCYCLSTSVTPLYTQNFLRDLLKEAKRNNDVSENKLIEYTDIMVSKVSPTSSPIASRRLFLPSV